jgi:hypothetical protein
MPKAFVLRCQRRDTFAFDGTGEHGNKHFSLASFLKLMNIGLSVAILAIALSCPNHPYGLSWVEFV